MKKAFLFFLIFAEAFLARAQLLQERLYRSDQSFKVINVSTLTSQGNVFLSGDIVMPPTLPYYQGMYLMIKPNTDTLWTRKGPPLRDGGMSIKQAGNSLFFSGTLQLGFTPYSDIVLEKLSLNGSQQWRKTVNFGDIDHGMCMQIMPDKDIVIAGFGCPTNQYSRFAVTRFDSLGNTIRWQKDYDWSGVDIPGDIQFTNNGNILIVGLTQHGSFFRVKLLELDQNGDSVRGARPIIVGANRDERFGTFSGISPLSDGGYLITGQVDTIINSSRKFMGFVAKLNHNFQLVWRYVQRGKLSGDYYYTKTRELTDGSLLALSFGINNQFYLSRFSATGILQNTYTFNSSLVSKIYTSTMEYLASDSTFMIGGDATVTPNPNYTSAFYVAKVKLPANVPQVLATKPELVQAESLLGQSYPNPATESAIIPFNLPNSYKQANILIRDITGRKIGNYAIKKNSSNLEISLSNFSSGLYTYTLLLDEKSVATKKLSIIK